MTDREELDKSNSVINKITILIELIVLTTEQAD